VADSTRLTRAARTVASCALGLGTGLALAACGASTSSAVPAGTTAAAASSPAAAATPSGPFVSMQSAAGGEFLSPSGNISCEIDYQRAGLTEAYCQTQTPARSVTMTAAGTYTTCVGQQCLGNPGTGTPTLAYGTATGVGPFRCESATAGVTCTANGKGFRISASGVTREPA
jgi:hypothetical protein